MNWTQEYSVLLAFLTSLFISTFSIPTIINVAKLKHLYDEPDHRKSHHSKIPTLGGIAILLGFLFSISFWVDFSFYKNLQYVITASIVIAVIGIKDDIIGLSPLKKAIGQLIAALILVVFGDFRISSWFGIFGVTELPSLVSIVFSLFTVLVIINAFNLIDGINGLAASMGIISSLAYGTYFYFFNPNTQNVILSVALTGALLGFLYFNITPAKIFMGDTGSMLIGIVMSILAIEFINNNLHTQSQLFFRATSAPTLAMSIIFLPLFDLIRMFSIRIYRGKSPFKPDKNHLHHLLLNAGYSHMKATFILSAFSIFLILVAFILHFKGNYWIGFTLLFLSLIFTWVLYRKSTQKLSSKKE